MKSYLPLRFAFTVLVALLIPALCSAQQSPPEDKPVAANAEKLKRYEEAIAPYVKKARESLPSAKAKYLEGLKPGEVLFVTIRLYDDQKRFEQVYVQVSEWTGTTIRGVLGSDLELVKNHKKGEKITCKQEDIYDWTISKPDGTEEGNFVGKFLDTYKQ